MEYIQFLLDFLKNAEGTLDLILQRYDTLIYAFLFLVIFAETGFVVTPFLPGDSLLFVVGAFCGAGKLSAAIVLILLIIAAVIGDAVNYYLGYHFGEKILGKGIFRFVKKEHLDRTREFYDRHGKKTIILARFVPIVRTFAPFVAGIGKMSYRTFFAYNVIGGVAWVVICVGAGYFLGNIPLVKRHFEKVVLLIIFVSVLPIVFEYFKHRKEAARKAAESA